MIIHSFFPSAVHVWNCFYICKVLWPCLFQCIPHRYQQMSAPFWKLPFKIHEVTCSEKLSFKIQEVICSENFSSDSYYYESSYSWSRTTNKELHENSSYWKVVCEITFNTRCSKRHCFYSLLKQRVWVGGGMSVSWMIMWKWWHIRLCIHAICFQLIWKTTVCHNYGKWFA